jgi:hypothetical protein
MPVRGVCTGEVAFEFAAHLRDRLAAEELPCPQILTDDVIGNVFDVPLGIRGWSVPLVGANTVHGALNGGHPSHIKLACCWTRHDRPILSYRRG